MSQFNVREYFDRAEYERREAMSKAFKDAYDLTVHQPIDPYLMHSLRSTAELVLYLGELLILPGLLRPQYDSHAEIIETHTRLRKRLDYIHGRTKDSHAVMLELDERMPRLTETIAAGSHPAIGELARTLEQLWKRAPPTFQPKFFEQVKVLYRLSVLRPFVTLQIEPANPDVPNMKDHFNETYRRLTAVVDVSTAAHGLAAQIREQNGDILKGSKKRDMQSLELRRRGCSATPPSTATLAQSDCVGKPHEAVPTD